MDDFLESLKTTRSESSVTAQVMRTQAVVSKEHILEAARFACEAHAAGRGVAEDLGVELLLFASGQRQIGRAIERFGLKAPLAGAPVVACFLSGVAEESERLIPRLLPSWGFVPTDHVHSDILELVAAVEANDVSIQEIRVAAANDGIPANTWQGWNELLDVPPRELARLAVSCLVERMVLLKVDSSSPGTL